jgi:Holliday junction resolvase
MSSKAKAKGSGFERQLCEILNKIFNLSFMRVPNSGAFLGGGNSFRKATMAANQQLMMTGDIIMPPELDQWSLECKFYKDFSFASLYTENAQIDKWITQSKEAGKLWFLLFKVNQQGIHVAFDKRLVPSLNLPQNYMVYKDCYIVYIENFFENNKENILSLNKNPIKLIYASSNTLNTTTPSMSC